MANCDGRFYTWAIFWYVAIFKQNGLTLWPRDSIAANVGMDGSGEHCDPTKTFYVDISEIYIEKFPNIIEENVEAGKAVGEWLSCKNLDGKPLWRKILSRIKFILKDK